MFLFNFNKTSRKNCEILRKPLFMSLSVKNVQQNFKGGNISVENFEIPGLLPSRTTDEIIGKLGQVFH